MSQPKPPRLPKAWLSELEASGLPWSIDNGHKHFKLYVADRLAGVFSHGASREGITPTERGMVKNIRRTVERIRKGKR